MPGNATSPIWIHYYGTAIPVWAQVVLAIVVCTLILMFLTCLAMCCMRLCGCWTGNMFGYGATKRPLEETDHVGCWCCRPPLVSKARIVNDSGSYVIQMRRLPEWLQILMGIAAGVACLLLLTCLTLCCMRLFGCWTGNIMGIGSLQRPLDDADHVGCWCCRPPYPKSSRIDDDRGSYVLQVRKEGSGHRSTPAVPQNTWMPHTHPVRNNNTSTQ